LSGSRASIGSVDLRENGISRTMTRTAAVAVRKGFALPNANYLAGRRFEYAVMAALRQNAYKVLRTAGSHGEFDIIAYKPNSTVFVQCKVVESEASRDRLARAWRSAPPNPPAEVSFNQQLWIKVKGSSGHTVVSA